MTSFKLLANNAKDYAVNNSLDNLTTDAVFTLKNAGAGSKFPDTAEGTFYVTVYDRLLPDPSDDPNMEILLVTSRNGDTFTTSRSNPKAHAGEPIVALFVLVSHFDDIHTAINALEEGKANLVHEHPVSDITGLTTTNVSEGTNLYYTDARADARITAQKAQANGLATLDANGKLLDSQVSAIAITDTFVVNTQSAMLALTAEIGDVAVRTDLNKSFILTVADASVLANWQELLTPTDAVASVSGKTGVVTLTKTDVGLSNVDNTSDATKNTATTVLANKQINFSTSQSDKSATGLYVSLNYGESIVMGDSVYLKNDGYIYKADANGVGTYPSIGIALVTAASGINKVLLHGTYRDDTRFNWTPGGILYLSTTAGELTQTQPTGVDEVVQIVGIALTADIVYINPSLDYMTHA